MSKVVVFFAEGTEECEALLVVDLLRRAKVEVTEALQGIDTRYGLLPLFLQQTERRGYGRWPYQAHVYHWGISSDDGRRDQRFQYRSQHDDRLPL